LRQLPPRDVEQQRDTMIGWQTIWRGWQHLLRKDSVPGRRWILSGKYRDAVLKCAQILTGPWQKVILLGC
jgi:hypothetical protein